MDSINVDKEISANDEENTIEKEIEGEDITLNLKKIINQILGYVKKRKKQIQSLYL